MWSVAMSGRSNAELSLITSSSEIQRWSAWPISRGSVLSNRPTTDDQILELAEPLRKDRLDFEQGGPPRSDVVFAMHRRAVKPGQSRRSETAGVGETLA